MRYASLQLNKSRHALWSGRLTVCPSTPTTGPRAAELQLLAPSSSLSSAAAPAAQYTRQAPAAHSSARSSSSSRRAPDSFAPVASSASPPANAGMATRGARRRGGDSDSAAATAPVDDATAVDAIRSHAIRVPPPAAKSGVSRSRAAARVLLEHVPASARIVMLGEATHGTREFYEQRAELTKLLIAERGFTAVVVESDWPDAARVNRYVRGLPRPEEAAAAAADVAAAAAASGAPAGRAGAGTTAGHKPGYDASAEEALSDYKRFPKWMWRNRTVVEFVEWLRRRNLAVRTQHGDKAPHRGAAAALAGAAAAEADKGDEAAAAAAAEGGGGVTYDAATAAAQCGFYGMDVYSLHSSAEAVLRYLRETDPQSARVVEARYRCFDRHGADAQSYGLATSIFRQASCEEAVRRALAEVRRRVGGYREAPPGGPLAHEAALEVEANAMVVSGAEAYYRNMFSREEVTWNLRDRHFLAVLQLVEAHLGRLKRGAAEQAAVEEAEGADGVRHGWHE